MRRSVTPVLLLLLPMLAFLAFFHVETLDIGNVGWLLNGSDAGENALGLHAYRYDPAAGLSLRTYLLNAPQGVPVLFTDSNPLVTLAAKLASPLLPGDAQLIGPFILLCLIAQTLFAWALLRRHAPGPVALWIGVALLAFPPTLFNRFVHANLMAHWLILAALWLFLDPVRSRTLRWWGPLIVLAALIHSYLLVMVGAIWASALLVRFTQGPRPERIAVLGQGTAVLVLVALLAHWLGVGGQLPAGNFGFYSMPLDALWNPAIPSFTNLLPAHETSPGRGFEGFHYLGAGGLLLVAAAILAALRLPADARQRVTLDRLRGLAPALIVLAIIAVVRLPLPETVRLLLDPVRASGRLFWPVGYVLILVALLAVYRLSAERAALLLVAVLTIQIVDLDAMAYAIRAQSDAAARAPASRLRDPRWIGTIASARSIAFMPGDVTRDLGLFQEIAWQAAKLHRPVTNVYAARADRAAVTRLHAEADAFRRGTRVPGRLYVVTDDRTLPAAMALRARRIDGVRLVLP
ncbi:DUF6311 domain-containing protein [Sphingomonas kyungheensis]|uniref:DUF6311 domain-containing protein n=1 Tax=Sphingomonas kyungheensis TaxID=1069987 RepID=A0ABU8H783_9SPHN